MLTKKDNTRSVKRMKLFAIFRQRRRAGPVLGAVVLAMLGMAAMPCAMALSLSTPATATAHVVSSHDHCPHATSTRPITGESCCCDPDVVPKVQKQELPKPTAELMPAVGPYVLLPLIEDRYRIRPNDNRKSVTALPVYLITLRLRI